MRMLVRGKTSYVPRRKMVVEREPIEKAAPRSLHIYHSATSLFGTMLFISIMMLFAAVNAHPHHGNQSNLPVDVCRHT